MSQHTYDLLSLQFDDKFTTEINNCIIDQSTLLIYIFAATGEKKPPCKDAESEVNGRPGDLI